MTTCVADVTEGGEVTIAYSAYEYSVSDRLTGEEVAKGSADECGEIVGYSPSHLYCLYKKGGNDRIIVTRRKKSVKEIRSGDSKLNGYYYTVYLKKNDKVLCSGTARECADAMGFGKKNATSRLNTFHSVVSKTRAGMVSKYSFCIERPDGSMESF